MDLTATNANARGRRAAKLTRRRLLTASAGLIGLSVSAAGAYAGAIEPLGLVVTRYALDAAGLARGPQTHHHGDRRPACRRSRYAAAAHPARCRRRAGFAVRPRGAARRFQGVVPLVRDPNPSPIRTGRPNWRGLKLRSAPGRSSATTIGGTTLPAFAPRWPACTYRCSKTMPCCWARRGSGSGWPGSAIRSPTASATVDSAASTICRARWRVSNPTIRCCFLVHEPDIFPQIPDRVALTLAGHTHGGQIRLPLVWPNFVPSKYGARFAYGHVIEDGRHMIVSGGLGTSIVPARFGVPPEIVHVTLGA